MAQNSPNDRIRIATIGIGGMGSGDTRMALQIPGVELVAVADLYDGRLARAKENWGAHIATTRDYREILARKDVDAVIIGTSDHYHSQISIDAMNAGKDVYCEKPMVQKIEQGHEVVAAQKKTGRIFQVGSQYASSLSFQKARDLLSAGSIGELNMVEAWLDRNSAIGAWQYSIPPDASPQTVDWDRYTAITPKRDWDAKRFFRWRNYQDYGTGVAGDLYVHLLTGLHVVTGATGPNRVYSTGGLRYWKDGRDVPDIALALLLAGIALGVGGTTWFMKSGEIRTLNHTIRTMSEARKESDAKGLETVTRLEKERQAGRRLITKLQREVNQNVQDNRVCDYNQSARRMLNSARGYRLPDGAADPTPEEGAAPAFTQRTATEFWLADIGEYNDCANQLNALIDFLANR